MFRYTLSLLDNAKLFALFICNFTFPSMLLNLMKTNTILQLKYFYLHSFLGFSNHLLKMLSFDFPCGSQHKNAFFHSIFLISSSLSCLSVSDRKKNVIPFIIKPCNFLHNFFFFFFCFLLGGGAHS